MQVEDAHVMGEIMCSCCVYVCVCVCMYVCVCLVSQSVLCLWSQLEVKVMYVSLLSCLSPGLG